MFAAAAREVGAEFFEVCEIRLPQDGRVEQVFHAVALHALELRPALELEVQLVRVPDLEDEDLVARVAEVREGLEEI